MNSIYQYLPFSPEEASSICISLSRLVGSDDDNQQALVENYWQKIKTVALKAQAAIELEQIDISKQKRAGQKLKRLGKIKHPRYRHDKEIMALLYLGALRKGYITNPPIRLNEKKYRSILFELKPSELSNAAREAYSAGLRPQSLVPILILDKGGRPSGEHYIDYAKSILTIYNSASTPNPNKADVEANKDLTNVFFLDQCLAPGVFARHPFTSTASMIEHASILP